MGRSRRQEGCVCRVGVHVHLRERAQDLAECIHPVASAPATAPNWASAANGKSCRVCVANRRNPPDSDDDTRTLAPLGAWVRVSSFALVSAVRRWSSSGGRGIRTHDAVADITVFKTAALGHYASPPRQTRAAVDARATRAHHLHNGTLPSPTAGLTLREAAPQARSDRPAQPRPRSGPGCAHNLAATPRPILRPRTPQPI